MLDGAGVTTSSAAHTSKSFVTNTNKLVNKSSLPWQPIPGNDQQTKRHDHACAWTSGTHTYH
jgi:hypothetical protein